MARRRLPIGIQTFRKLREANAYYVDKTPYIERLLDEGTHYFLSRPRRFGKSLFLDTLKELFEGNEPLSAGLHIHDRRDWSLRNPVLRLNFGGNYAEPGYLQEDLNDQLEALEERMGVPARRSSGPIRFRRLITSAHERTGRRVVVLVDEYDKPILDVLDTPRLARANRDFLRGLYGTIEECDEHVRFAFITGVSKFLQGRHLLRPRQSRRPDPGPALLRHLRLHRGRPRHRVCAGAGGPRPPPHARLVQRLQLVGRRQRVQPVRHPAAVPQTRFDAYWFETGTPTFLIDVLIARRVATLDRMAVEALLFQAGHLTIKSSHTDDLNGGTRYRLGYPNREVRQSLNESLLAALTPNAAQLAGSPRLRELLEANDFDGIEALLRAHFDGIPYEWHTRNDIAGYEGYYASVLYSCFAALGFDIVAEDGSARGRADMTLRFNDLYIFELKVAELAGPGSALAQLQERGYAGKYRGRGEPIRMGGNRSRSEAAGLGEGQPIHLIGVEFSRITRNVTAFAVADG